MAIENKIKRTVAKQWMAFFPTLSLLSSQRLYKILGLIIVGIDLIPNLDMYDPCFVIYPLYGGFSGTDLKSLLGGPMIYVDKTMTGRCYLEKSEKHVIKAMKDIRDFSGPLFQGDIAINEFLDYIDKYLLLEAADKSTGIVDLYLLKIFASLYVGNVKLAQNICNEITSEEIKWEAHNLSKWYSDAKNPFFQISTYKEWLNNLQAVIDNPAPMLQTIEINKNDPKLRKLKRSEILLR